jgi:hypothetical protein
VTGRAEDEDVDPEDDDLGRPVQLQP